MNSRTIKRIVFLATCVVPSGVDAQMSSASYEINPAVMDSGGGPASSATYAISSSSIGGMIGVANSSNYEISSSYVAQVAFGSMIDLFDYDSWKTLFFDASDSEMAREDDADGDGVTNEEEFFALTNPIDPASRLQVSIRREPSGYEITFSPRAAESLRRYSLKRGADLRSFPTLVSESPTTIGLEGLFANIPGFGPKQFFRIEVRLANE